MLSLKLAPFGAATFDLLQVEDNIMDLEPPLYRTGGIGRGGQALGVSLREINTKTPPWYYVFKTALLRGNILRYTDDGTDPDPNPVASHQSYVFSLMSVRDICADYNILHLRTNYPNAKDNEEAQWQHSMYAYAPPNVVQSQGTTYTFDPVRVQNFFNRAPNGMVLAVTQFIQVGGSDPLPAPHFTGLDQEIEDMLLGF